MKIDTRILSIPPYISTAWKNITSLHIENQGDMLVLVVTLVNGARIEIPRLQASILEAIFAAHARFLDQESQPKHHLPKLPLNFPITASGLEQVFALGFPVKGGSDSFTSLIQHNPEQADSPDLPADLLQKISALAKTLGIEDPHSIPQAEPHCNCMHCQIARALQVGLNASDTASPEEEIVRDEDLTFRTWDITQTGDKLYTVTNPLDTHEHYSVFLGEPVGCTCGEKHCEHIRSVLNS